MPLQEDEMKALRLVIREELQLRFDHFEMKIDKRFDQVATQIDGLYERDAKREQEYLFIREQIRRLENRFA